MINKITFISYLFLNLSFSSTTTYRVENTSIINKKGVSIILFVFKCFVVVLF